MSTNPWFLMPRFRRLAVTSLAVVVVLEGVNAIFFRENDFNFHLDLGREFLDATAFQLPKTPYPLGRLAFDGLLSLLPYYLARTLCYVVAVAGLAWALKVWNRLAPGRVDGRLAFAAGVLTLGLLYPYVIRDLDDCGLQILLLVMLTAGFRAVVAGKNLSAGMWLAAAASYKLTPLLFLPFLIWKRKLRAAAWMGIGLLAFNLVLPGLILRPSQALAMHERWVGRMQACAQVRDPSANGVEPARHQNQCLPMAIARFVQSYPPGHDLFLEHPLYFELADFDAESARGVVMTCLLGLAAVLAWRFRRPWPPADRDPRRIYAEPAPEWAAACILCALLSQLCWLQHLVLVIPAVFLIVRAELTHRATGGSWKNRRTLVLAIIGVIVLLLQRDVVGRDLSIVVLSYKFDTFAVLLAMATVLTLRNSTVHVVSRRIVKPTDNNERTDQRQCPTAA